MGPRRHWVVLGSFTPRPLLWDSELSSIRVKRFLLKSNFRFSKILSPGEALQSRWSPTAPEDFEDTLRFSLETLCPLPLQFPTTEISLWINTYTCRAYFYSQSILLLQDTLRIFCAYCLAVLCHLNTTKNNFSHFLSIRSSPVVQVFQKSLWNTIQSSKKSLAALLLCKYLSTCIMDASHISSNIH